MDRTAEEVRFKAVIMAQPKKVVSSSQSSRKVEVGNRAGVSWRVNDGYGWEIPLYNLNGSIGRRIVKDRQTKMRQSLGKHAIDRSSNVLGTIMDRNSHFNRGCIGFLIAA